MGSIIQTQDLHFSYTTAEGVSPVVLDGVNLEIEEGSFVAVLGHNGSGKSTLAKHMNAILLPSGGKVFVSGMDTADDNLLLDILSHAEGGGAAAVNIHLCTVCLRVFGGVAVDADKIVGTPVICHVYARLKAGRVGGTQHRFGRRAGEHCLKVSVFL